MRSWMKEKRQEMSLTLLQVANAIGVSESYYKLIEDGARQKRLDLTMAERIGKVYGLSIGQVATLEEATTAQ